jgi:hypothetical protein
MRHRREAEGGQEATTPTGSGAGVFLGQKLLLMATGISRQRIGKEDRQGASGNALRDLRNRRLARNRPSTQIGPVRRRSCAIVIRKDAVNAAIVQRLTPERGPVKSLLLSLWMNTMIRCSPPSRGGNLSPLCVADDPAHRCVSRNAYRKRSCLAALLLCATAFGAHAQQVRDFPVSALRGSLEVTLPPQVLLDGHPDRLAPGARIRNMQNLFVLSGSIAGQQLLVNYTRDPSGLLRDVWILTPEEARLKRESAHSGSNLIFRFGR